MREVNNFFEITAEEGEFTLSDGVIKLEDNYLLNQFIAVTGSKLNNGIYLIAEITLEGDGDIKYFYTLESANGIEDDNISDETFTGIIYGLAVPKDFIALVGEISKTVNPPAEEGLNFGPTPGTGIVSERFGSYNYTLATDKNGMPATWQDLFRNKLNKFRKMFNEVKI